MSEISELTREQLTDALFNGTVPIPMTPAVSAFICKLAHAPVYACSPEKSVRSREIAEVMATRVSTFTAEERERMAQWIAEESL